MSTLPHLVYRVDYPTAQTTYNPSSGFRAKNQTTILSTTFTLKTTLIPHLTWATNRSSPFISVFSSKSHAEQWARHLSAQKGGMRCYVLTINTRMLGRGPVFRAEDWVGEVVEGGEGMGGRELTEWSWNHEGEYLIMYKIPKEAIVDELDVGGEDEVFRALGLE
ncbi:hypothetical protein K469DRAFT_560036 [Zopfia rhizophila CBS 207.26]|uniref:DUF7587 domain-containing protein n=1 Tax=Zopfia rhizophila CBS 207.26 TaxID=1314779 RepID=A0A6A6EGE7_9PEZI|nr:hypothetical protein K469DRAFT_560036 [Zopfia rhizophila CBS 207.26]